MQWFYVINGQVIIIKSTLYRFLLVGKRVQMASHIWTFNIHQPTKTIWMMFNFLTPATINGQTSMNWPRHFSNNNNNKKTINLPLSLVFCEHFHSTIVDYTFIMAYNMRYDTRNAFEAHHFIGLYTTINKKIQMSHFMSNGCTVAAVHFPNYTASNEMLISCKQ